MVKNSKKIFLLFTAIILQFAILFCLILFQRYLLMDFPIAVRAVLTIAIQWILLIVPVTLMLKNKEKAEDIGFSKTKISLQIFVGIGIGIFMALMLTVVPILMGFKDMVGNTSYTKAWQFAYDLIYTTLGVALVEEIFFRGYIFKKLLDVKNSKWFAIIISSFLFGLFHIFNGSIVQVIMTMFLGILLCVFREKVKNCSTLSLIIAHGLHNFLITLCVAIL